MDFREMMMDRFRRNPFAGYVGIVPEEVGEGYARARLPYRQEITNVGGTVHGGALYSLADMTASYAAVSYGDNAVTSSADFHYVSAAANTENIHAEARIIKRGRKLIVTCCDITDDAGKLLVTSTFTFCTIEKK